jgi:hypothetical protein
MATLLSSGQAADLQEAYDQACWADPAVRPLILTDQQRAAQAKAADEARAKAWAARRASGSVTGAPGAGGSPSQRASNPNASVEDDVREAYALLRA